MKNRAVRIALFLLAVLAFGGSGYELVLAENQAVAAHGAADAFQQKAQRLAASIRELRAAEYAFVAPGQGAAFWTGRAENLVASIKTDLTSLCASATAESADRPVSAAGTDAKPGAASCADARNDLAAIERAETNVRADLRAEQTQPAADLVFGELREANQALLAHVEEVRLGQAAADAMAAATLRTRQLATVGGAALFAVLILLLLTPGGGKPSTAKVGSSQPASGDNADTSPASSLPLHGGHLSITMPPTPPPADLKVRPAAASAERESAEGVREPRRPQAEPGLRRPAAPSGVGAAELSAAAGLCTDLAQLHEPAALHELLERVAKLLDAAGIVVWVDDAASAELRPALSHGYPAHALTRMRAISRSDDNATASAFRDRVLRVVPGDAHGNGAVAVPLLGPRGCVGVMAAEIRGGRECDRSTQALATIVAAQLAVLVNPLPAETEMNVPGELRVQVSPE